MERRAVATNINPNQSSLAVATNLRVVSMSIAAYEYVASRISPPLIVTHVRSATSSPSLWSFSCTSLLIESGKKVDIHSQRESLDRNTFDRLGLILFILIRYVFQLCRLQDVITDSVGIRA